MGFFSTLFGKKKVSVPAKPDPPTQSLPVEPDIPAPSLPTVKLRPELAQAFSDSFSKHVAELGCFSKTEIGEMVAFIANVPSGFPNMGGWFFPIYDKYFKPRNWFAPFLKKFYEDLAFKDETEFERDTFERVCHKIKVADKKTILSKMGVDFDKKAKNPELFELLIQNANEESLIAIVPELVSNLEEVREKSRKDLYDSLMRHIRAYANNLCSARRAEEWGVKYRIKYLIPTQEARAKLILERDPKAIPPFFLGDLSAVRHNRE